MIQSQSQNFVGNSSANNPGLAPNLGVNRPVGYNSSALQFLIAQRRTTPKEVARQMSKLNKNLDRQLSQGQIIKNYFPSDVY